MNNVPCKVIQDLLVLYEDDVCSEESKTLIEEHISDCEECRKIYDKMQDGLPEITLDNDKELEENQRKMFVQSVKKYIRNVTFKQMLFIGILLLILLTGDIIYRDHFQQYIKSVPASDVKVSEIYRLNNGSIYCTLKTPQPFNAVQASSIEVPNENRYKNYNKGWHEVHFQYPKPFTNTSDLAFFRDTISLVFPMEEYGMSPWGGSKPYHYTASSIKYYGKSKKDTVTLWKKGQKIPEAPIEIEKKAIEEYIRCGHVEKAVRECKDLGITFNDLNMYDPTLSDALSHYSDYNQNPLDEGSWTYHITDN